MTRRNLDQPSPARLLWLLPLLAAGLGSLLASSTFDEGQDSQSTTPVVVDFLLGSLAAPIAWDAGSNLITVSNLRFAGSYDANAGNKLTLERSIVNVDTTSGFDVTIVDQDPEDNDDLAGVLSLSVTSPIGLPDGANQDPSSGQFSFVNDGTTTVGTIQTNPDGVSLAVGAAAAVFFNWTDFADLETDDGANNDFRLAYMAYVQLERMLALALGAEALLQAIDDNEQTLESMNLNEALNLSCDASGGDAVLLWRTDRSGSGQGEVSDGDGFEARFENCFDSTRQRYEEGIVLLDNYTEAKGESPRTLAIDADYGNLFLSTDPIDSLTVIPAVDSPRINGGLALIYEETLVTDPGS